MEHLKGLSRNTIKPKIPLQKDHRITMLSQPTPIQKRAFELLKISVT